MADERSPLLPDVPTFSSLGYPDLTIDAWGGFLAPRGLAPDRRERLRQVAAILALLAAYLALWDAVPFVWRTPLLLSGIYRTVGEPWLRSSVLAVSITALLVGVFDALLRVRL